MSEADKTERFDEMTKGYWDSRDASMKFIDMDKRIPCSRQKTNGLGINLRTVFLGEQEEYTSSRDEKGLCIPAGEHRGITIRQLRAIWANIQRRCKDEGWTSATYSTPLEPEDVNQYDVDRYIISPFTQETGRSLVESLPSTAGAQPPIFSVSCSLEDSFHDILQCLEQFMLDFSRNQNKEHEKKGGGMTADTPIWMHIFAISSEEREKEDIFGKGQDPCKSVFARAIEVADFRLLTIHDHKNQFPCQMTLRELLQVFVTLMLSDNDGSWVVYTRYPHDHDDGYRREAVGLCAGGAPSDACAEDTLNRERHFPMQIILKFLGLKVQYGEDANASDRHCLLNRFIEKTGTDEIDHEPPTEHEKYDEFNDIIRAHFATSGTLHTSLNHNPEHWEAMLLAMSRGRMKHGMRIDFRRGRGWDNLTNTQASDLIRHFPRTIKSLEIIGGKNYGFRFLEVLAGWISESVNLQKLKLDKDLLGSISDHERVVALPLASELASLLTVRSVAGPILTSLQESLNDNSPDYDKITFLLATFIDTTFIDTGHPFNFDRTLVRDIIQWTLNLDSDKRAALLSSKAGSFIKMIMNQRLTNRRNLFIVMLDLYVQIAIVIAISFYMENARIVTSIMFGCLAWISLREFCQMMTSDGKEYVKEASNWFDLAQIGHVIWVIRFLQSTDTRTDEDVGLLVSTIFVIWSSLFFKFGGFNFHFSMTIISLVEITLKLLPLLLATTLITFMFALMFRVQYSQDQCSMNDATKGLDTWECVSIGQSYQKSLSMFLTDGGWDFDDQTGIGVMFLFAFIEGILLLNLTIGIATKTFTDIIDDAWNKFWSHRLSSQKETDALGYCISDISDIISFFTGGYSCIGNDQSETEVRYDIIIQRSPLQSSHLHIKENEFRQIVIGGSSLIGGFCQQDMRPPL